MCRAACRLQATVAAYLLQQIKSDSKLRGAQPDPSRVGGNCVTPTRHTRVGTSTDSQHQLWLDNPPFSGMASQAFTTIVSGPGQKASARHRKARSSSGEANTASFTAASASGTCTISGSVTQHRQVSARRPARRRSTATIPVSGRPLYSKILSTADSSSALAPRPYTVSALHIGSVRHARFHSRGKTHTCWECDKVSSAKTATCLSKPLFVGLQHSRHDVKRRNVATCTNLQVAQTTRTVQAAQGHRKPVAAQPMPTPLV